MVYASLSGRIVWTILVAAPFTIVGHSPLQAKARKSPKPYELNLERPSQKETAPAEKSVEARRAEPKMESEPADQDPLQESSAQEELVPAQTAPAQAVAEEAPNVVPLGSRMHQVWIWQETRDCLWRLAKTYYNDPWKWKRIYLANRNTILDPAVIFPKQSIVIPQLDRPDSEEE